MRYSLGPAFLDIFSRPVIVFEHIKAGNLKAWSALFILIVVTLSVFGWYFFTIDILRYVAESSAQSGTILTDEQLDMMRSQQSVIRASSTVAVAVSLLIQLAIISLYLFLVATVASEVRVTYSQWFSLVSWGSIPTLIGVVSIAISYSLVIPGYADLLSLNQTSLNSFYFNLDSKSSGYTLANFVSFGGAWSWVIYALGYSHLSHSKDSAGFIVIGIPLLILFAVIYWFF